MGDALLFISLSQSFSLRYHLSSLVYLLHLIVFYFHFLQIKLLMSANAWLVTLFHLHNVLSGPLPFKFSLGFKIFPP